MTAAGNLKVWPLLGALLCFSINHAAAKEKDIQIQLDGLCNVLTFHFDDNDFDKSLLGFEEHDACDGMEKYYGLGLVSKFHGQRVLIANQISAGTDLLELFIFSYPLSTGGTFTYYATDNGIEIDGGLKGTYTVLTP